MTYQKFTYKFNFDVINIASPVAVQSFRAEERISGLYETNLWLVSEDKIHFDDVIQSEAVLTIAGAVDRHFHGIINHFMLIGKAGRFYSYQANVVPSLWFLSLNRNHRIFQDVKTEDIVRTILDENNISTDCFEFRLANDYNKRRYCTQYGESDFHFISRLLEEEGIFYFFEHSEDAHVLVFADDPVAYLNIPGESILHINPNSGTVVDKEVIETFSYLRSVLPGKATHTNYNFKRPSLNLRIEEASTTHDDVEVFEYPGAYGYQDPGRQRVRARLEEHKTYEKLAQGSSNCGRFTPGLTFRMTHNDFDDMNTSYLLVSVHHVGGQPNVTGEYSGIGGDFSYSNEFVAIPAATTFRPEKAHKKPVVAGPQPAVVVGPKDEEIYVDEYCRVKVQFPWDRVGVSDEKSSCWVRVLQGWGGGGWGSVFVPRIGDEVAIQFWNGDPDHPMLVGSLYNGENMPLYDLKQYKTRATIKTRSYPKGGPDNFHELRFEDKKGSEEIYLQSEKDWNILVKNDKGQTVGHNETLHVKNDRVKHVDGNEAQVIGINKNELVRINKCETIGLAKELSVGGLYQVTVGAAMNETVGAAKTEEVGLAKAVLVGTHMSERVIGNRTLSVGDSFSSTVTNGHSLRAKTIMYEASDEIVFKVGSASISMKSNGDIVVKGGRITTKGTGEVVIKGAKVGIN